MATVKYRIGPIGVVFWTFSALFWSALVIGLCFGAPIVGLLGFGPHLLLTPALGILCLPIAFFLIRRVVTETSVDQSTCSVTFGFPFGRAVHRQVSSTHVLKFHDPQSESEISYCCIIRVKKGPFPFFFVGRILLSDGDAFRQMVSLLQSCSGRRTKYGYLFRDQK